jgi:hypothetical protein
MKISIATPLFPPDIENPAPYIKELASRLAQNHEVYVLLYGHLPEAVAGVQMSCVDKRQHLLMRLISFTRALLSITRHGDVLIVENGPSVELPLLIVTLVSRIPYILLVGDPRAEQRAQRRMYRWLAQTVQKRASTVLKDFPPVRPELLPLEPHPTQALATYERAWHEHCETLNSLITHA